MTLLEYALEANGLSDFINDLIEIINDEMESKTKWEFYLHSAFLEKSYNEFYNVSDQDEGKAPAAEVYDDDYVETTKQNAKNILKKFKMK